MERKQYFDQFSVDVAINYPAKLAYKIVGWLGCRKSVLTQNTVTFTINKVKLFSKTAHRVLNLPCSYTKLRWLQSCTKLFEVLVPGSPRQLGQPRSQSFSPTSQLPRRDVTFKINSRFFKLNRVYFNSLEKSNVGAFPWSWFLGDRLKFFKFRKRKKNSPLSLPSLVFVLHETWNFETLCKRTQELAAAALGKLTGLVFEIPGKKFFKTVTCLKEFNQVNFFIVGQQRPALFSVVGYDLPSPQASLFRTWWRASLGNVHDGHLNRKCWQHSSGPKIGNYKKSLELITRTSSCVHLANSYNILFRREQLKQSKYAFVSFNDNRNLRKYIIDFIVKISNVFSNKATSEHSATLLKFIYIGWATPKRFFVTTTWNNQTKTKPKSPHVIKSKRPPVRRTQDHKNIVFDMQPH